MSFINTIREDIKTVQAQDPAAQNGLVIFLSYPGLHAKWNHVPEHWLWEHGHRSLARVLSQLTRHITGVEIHPAAQIGKHFFIDHAMGVVIGETAIVGDNCVLYQGVTLGGTGNETGKRHPTLGNNVMVGSGAKVLGPFTVGDNARIAAGAVVLSAVPEDCTAVGVPAEVVRINNKAIVPSDDLDQQDLPDVTAQRLTELDRRISAIERAAQGDTPPTAEQLAKRRKN